MTTRKLKPAAAREDAPAPDPMVDLRRQAEERLDRLSAAAAASPVPKDIAGAVHELRVHQIELEMQNEELLRAQLELGASRAKYFELFDLAPVGYLTLSDKNIVGDANFTAAHLLGVERRQIVGRPFSTFIFAPDREVFYRHQLMLKQTGEPQTCELRLRRAGAGAEAGAGAAAAPAHFWAHLVSQPPRTNGGEADSSRATFNDVTARKLAEEALRESEANFRAFFDTVDDMIVVASPDGALVYANPAVSARLGYSADELSGTQVLDLYPAGKRGEVEAMFAAMLKGERESSAALLQSKSGALVPVETRVWLGRWNGAECVFGVSKDLTKEQEALQKFDRLFHGNPAPMTVNSVTEGCFTEVNEAFLSALGYSREEVLGHTSAELGLFIEPEQYGMLAEQLLVHGRVADRELKVRCKDGAVLDGLFFMEVVRSQAHLYVLTVMLDQTERKGTQEALRESEEKYRLLAEHTTDLVWLMDMDIRTTYQSPSGEKLRGYTSQELRDLPLEKDLTPESLKGALAVFLEEIPRIVADPGYEPVIMLELEYYRKDGSTFWLESRFSVIRDGGGKPVSILGEGRDITERRRAEEALQLQEMQIRAILESTDDGILAIDDAGRVIKTNRRFADLWHVPSDLIEAGSDEALLTHVLDQLVDPDAFLQKVQALYASSAVDLDTILFRDGRIVERYSCPLVSYGVINGRVWSFRDITEGKRAQEELARLNDELVVEAAALKEANATITRIAATDDLTGLANRRSFYQSLEKAVSLARRHGSPLSLVSFDLDGLKRVNDSAGHRAGDEVLTSFAALLIDLCRAEDLPGRLGGDEFSVLLPGIELGGGGGLAERARAAVRSCEALKVTFPTPHSPFPSDS